MLSRSPLRNDTVKYTAVGLMDDKTYDLNWHVLLPMQRAFPYMQ